jgi:hypothetical protein
MRVCLPHDWHLLLWSTPTPGERYRAVPDGGLILILHSQAGRGGAAWHSLWGGWRVLRTFHGGAGRLSFTWSPGFMVTLHLGGSTFSALARWHASRPWEWEAPRWGSLRGDLGSVLLRGLDSRHHPTQELVDKVVRAVGDPELLFLAIQVMGS